MASRSNTEGSEPSEQSREEVRVRKLTSITGHPLLISLILENTFQYHKIEDLKSFRLVAKAWDESVWPILKKKSICHPKLISSGDKTKSNDNAPPKATSSYCSCTTEWENKNYEDFFLNNIYPRVQLQNTSIYECIESKDEKHKSIENVVKEWFQENGHSIKGLQFHVKGDRCTLTRESFLRFILLEFCPNLEELEIITGTIIQLGNFKKIVLPNLKKIAINGQQQIKAYLPYSESSFPLDLLISAINLERLEINGQNGLINAILQKSNVKDNWLQNVNHLVLKADLETSDLVSLARLRNLKLTKLEIQGVFAKGVYSSWKETSDALLNLLKLHENSLKILKINGLIQDTEIPSDDEDYDYDRDNLSYFPIQLPYLEKLKVLEIRDIFHCRFDHLTSLIKFVPNLRKLLLKNVTYAPIVHPFKPDEYFEEFLRPERNDRRIHVNLEELYLGGEIMNTDGVECISKLFPNLKKADLFIHSAEVFNEVLSSFSQIEELKLKFQGISAMVWCETAFINHLPDMQCLRKLVLNHQATYPLQLTERAVNEGFLKARNLRWLHLTNFSICVTERERILQKLNHLVSLVFSECSFRTPRFDAEYGIFSNRVPISDEFTFKTD